MHGEFKVFSSFAIDPFPRKLDIVVFSRFPNAPLNKYVKQFPSMVYVGLMLRDFQEFGIRIRVSHLLVAQ